MSYPPGTPDPDAPRDPWATPSDQPQHEPPYGQPPHDQPQYGPPAYGPPQYGPPPGYGTPQYGGYQQPTNGKAQAAMWTGIGLLVLTFCCAGGILGFIPIILGVKARSEIRAGGSQQGGEGMALAGIITGAIALVLSLALIVLVVGAVLSFEGTSTSYRDTGV